MAARHSAAERDFDECHVLCSVSFNLSPGSDCYVVRWLSLLAFPLKLDIITAEALPIGPFRLS